MVTPTQPEIIYPDSDGQPMAENTEQFKWIVTIKENLELLFAENPNVFVAGDLLWYPVEGNNQLSFAPDAMVVFGRPKGYRGSYQQWKENNLPPQVVFEILSPGNRPVDMAKKFEAYEIYGVEEYYIYDPDRVRFEGWIRQGLQFQLIEPIANWISPRLGIRFELTPELVIYRPDGRKFLGFIELDELRQQAEQQAEQERQRADQAQLQAIQAQQRAEEAEAQLQVIRAKLKAQGINLDDL